MTVSTRLAATAHQLHGTVAEDSTAQVHALTTSIGSGGLDLGIFRGPRGHGYVLNLTSGDHPWLPVIYPMLTLMATIIDGRPAEQAGKPQFALGDFIQIGYAFWKVCRPDALMHDHVMLVPQHGPRYYLDYVGSSMYVIRDRQNDGVSVGRFSVAADHTTGYLMALREYVTQVRIIEGQQAVNAGQEA